MAPINAPEVQSGRCYTFTEAVDLMKEQDRFPTGTYRRPNWVSCKTGKSVSIGYN